MRSILGWIVFPVAGFLWAIPYMLVVGRVLGRRSLALVGAIGTFPVLTVVCGVLWVVVVAVLERRRRRPLGAGPRLLLSAIVAVLAGMFMTGFRGFTLAPGSELFNVFLPLAVVTGAAGRMLLAPPARPVSRDQ